MFDIYLTCIVIGLAIGILSPDAFNETNDLLVSIACLFAWVFVEALFLSTAGTTPGKWLFRTRVVPATGAKLDYSSALSRSFKVWWRGLGIGFPLASIITLFVAHGNLTKNGVTSWDRDDGINIVHDRIGPLRVLVAIIFFLGFLMLVALGSA
ncbi:putative RDD family membrane protein YckC [Lysobacter niastensis]|uniref:RDD family membrane protein YckC n=2 Tax=Lysobacter niastensis TaxID=380629 RepID=A0ABU1WAU0_9GAMM|nr:putative RDD family membrane protein YckC [Lysobacter niastensis]